MRKENVMDGYARSDQYNPKKIRSIAKKYAGILEDIGEDLTREGLAKTPERVAKALPNARHVALKGQGHNVFATGCMPKLLGQFIERADAKSLDTKCLDSIGPVPPFTSFNGWEP